MSGLVSPDRRGERVLLEVSFHHPDRAARFTGHFPGLRYVYPAPLERFVLARLGEDTEVKVYDGSWTGWGWTVGMPVER